MISIFNPELPERDFGAFFGATGGVFLGGIFGAIFLSALAAFFSNRRSRVDITPQRKPGENDASC